MKKMKKKKKIDLYAKIQIHITSISPLSYNSLDYSPTFENSHKIQIEMLKTKVEWMIKNKKKKIVISLSLTNTRGA